MSKQKKQHRLKQKARVGPPLGNLDGVLPSDEQVVLAEALRARPPKAVRVRLPQAHGPASDGFLPFSSEPVPWYSAGFFCNETHQPGRFLEHAAGAYFIQDAGSMLALRLLDVQPHEWVADVCAAPGGKASAILEKVGPGSGFLLANEPIRGRVPALEFNLARVGFPRYCVTSKDPERLDLQWAQQFDAVLVDAPCTGQMLVGRGRQSFAAFSDSQVTHSAARQQRIVSAAAQLVRPGGRLVYSTCTFAPAENEDVIETFLTTHDGWCVETVSELQQWQTPRSPGGYRLYPHRDRCAGAYAVRLRLTEKQ
ncbi:MAG: RsmB/NOP family class I SAM-dependent RNA methyltransferase, partial [Pirellulales bacterium]|nr:RsmB/NOP family class I SAM-dependent RNA methyltransferase [Pirellulales bacterium]